MFSNILGGLGGTIGSLANLAGAGGSGGDEAYKKAVQVLEALKMPGFNIENISAPDLKVFSQYFPEVYQAVVPDSVKLAVDSEVGRGAQVRSLATMEQMRSEGLPVQERVALNQAGRQIQGEAAATNRAVMRDLAQRGRLGGGEEIAARMQANQSAADLANQLGSNLQAQMMQNRLNATYGEGQLGGQVRSGDVDLSRLNAEYANRFNEMATGRQNEAAQWAAAQKNAGQLYNVQQAQRLGESNALNAYNAAMRNQEYANQMRQSNYQNAYNKATALANMYQNYGNRQDLQRAAKEQQILALGKGLGETAGNVADVFSMGF